jgi:DNA-binding NarL/FixJ family response regulator
LASTAIQLDRERSTGRRIIADREWASLAERLRLAPREVQVIKGVFDDQKELVIADELGISPHTVHTYLERIYRKLAVDSRVSLVVRVMSEILEGVHERTEENNG